MKRKNILRNSALVICAALIPLIVIVPASCKKEKDPLEINASPGTPQLPAQFYSYPSGQNALATLGRVLFYDRNLSLNNTTSCGSCHQQRYAFADNHPFSRGLFNGYTARNSSAIGPGSSNSFSPHNRFWDGRAANADTAVFMPVMNNVEMHVFDLNLLPPRLSQLSYYAQLFQDAYGSPEITVYGIRHALGCFVDNLYSFNSKFDLNQMDALAEAGEQIFDGKARCYSCHNGDNFNGYQSDYENIGLDANYSDIGRGRITHDAHDNGKFLVPSLRNVEYSAPYMHDGRYNTLREVIDHYDHGIMDSKNLSPVLRVIPDESIDSLNINMNNNSFDWSVFPVVQMGLTELEKQQLEAFLRSLSDPSFITDPKFSDPFIH
ncbi:MAG: hypothetical protein HY064_02820 [Bacteroidetes bacterium]|nr:hypothetical protein [Bacteroidota bacterium]